MSLLSRRALAGLLVGLLASGLAATLPAQARTPARGEPRLSYVEPRAEGGWMWQLWSPTGTRTLTRLAEAPQHVFWSKANSSVWYVLGDHVWRLNWQGRSAAGEQIASLPVGHGELRALWIDRTSGRPRIATRLPVEAADVLPPNGADAPRLRLRDGSVVPGLATPDWGLPFVVSVLELQPDGKQWKLVARRGTKDMAGDTPGLSVIDDLRLEAGASGDRLIESYGCASGQCSEAAASPQLRDAALRAAAASGGRPLKPDELAQLKRPRGAPSVVFGTVQGDTSHIRHPLLWVAADGRTTQALPIGERKQLALGLNGHWLLVADENGERPMLFDLRSGKLRLDVPAGRSAMWLPSR